MTGDSTGHDEILALGGSDEIDAIGQADPLLAGVEDSAVRQLEIFALANSLINLVALERKWQFFSQIKAQNVVVLR